jgi:hypothetical protein
MKLNHAWESPLGGLAFEPPTVIPNWQKLRFLPGQATVVEKIQSEPLHPPENMF